MNPLTTYVRWASIAAAAGLIGWAAYTVWDIKAERDTLQGTLATVTATRDGLQKQVDQAATTISTQAGQIGTLIKLDDQRQADTRILLARLDALQRSFSQRAIQLEALTHEDPDSRRWGDTPLPADVARLLNFPARLTAADSSPADRADHPGADALPPAGHQAGTQPPAGGGPAE